MQNNTKYIGYWWLPTNPERNVSGSLYIDPHEGIKLEIIGSLYEPNLLLQRSFSKSKNFHEEVLLGQTINGKCITLIDASEIKSICNAASNDLSTSIYKANCVLVGNKHFTTKQEIKFKSAEVRFSLLDEWLGFQPFDIDYFGFDDTKDKEFILKYRFPEKVEFYINAISSHFATNYVFYDNPKSYLNWELAHKGFIKLTPEEYQDINWYEKQFYIFQKLLTIMTGYPVYQMAFRAYGEEIYIDNNMTRREQFEIYKQSLLTDLQDEQRHPADLLINRPNLNTELSTIVNNWFEKTEILDPVITLYVATLSTPLGYAEFQLLNYAQALEALHRRVFGGKYISDEEYDPIYENIIKNIPDNIKKDHRTSLQNKIKYGNEFSQRKRIKLLLEDVWESCLDEFIENKSKFVENVVNTRNYLIHLDEKSANKAVVGIEIFYMAERLKVLLVTHILIQIGIPRDTVYRVVKEFSAFDYLKCKVEH